MVSVNWDNKLIECSIKTELNLSFISGVLFCVH